MPKKWNVLIIPSSADHKTYSLEITSRFILTTAIAAVVLLCISLAVVIYSGHRWQEGKVAQISALQSEIEARDNEFSRLQQEYSILENLEDKLRTIAGLKPRERSNLDASAGGQGGAYLDAPESMTPSSLETLPHESAEALKPDELLTALLELEDSFSEILDVFERESTRLSSIPSINPAASQEAWISSGFGYREDPFSGTRRFHDGCDIVAPRGTPVIAPADGIVTFAGWSDGLGRTIKIEHGYGYSTMYGHNDKLHVKKGDLVKRGDLIANLGSSGRSTGPHLHYEVHLNDRLVNPYKYVVE
jgi:murein DD-endopeptidase MepM/ murein hydrolase activator NlpD